MTRPSRPLLGDLAGLVFIAGAALTLITVIVVLAVRASGEDNPAPAPRPTTSTSTPMFCDGQSAVYPGTGVVEFSDACARPPAHEPPGTGPTTGPAGEPHQ